MKVRKQHLSNPRKQGAEVFSANYPTTHTTTKPVPHSLSSAMREVNGLDRWVASNLLQSLGLPGLNLILWDGVAMLPEVDDPVATVYFRDRKSLYLSLLRPDLYWGDLYSEGRVEVDGDLAGLLDIVYRGVQQGSRWGWWQWLNNVLGHRKIRNTLRRSRDNIHHHYDIGNEFYRLWLDTVAMQYTCAYYPDPGMTLEDAQIAKMRHICRKLQLKPGDRVVEAGCGWGGFSLFMAKHYGVEVKAYNISREQVKYAREMADREGLTDRVEYILDDYRNIGGKFDVFVSVGMLEHVGPIHYPLLGRIIDHCLTPDGRGLIHSIGRNSPRPINAWIERRIFPGAYPPTLREMMNIFETNSISVLDVENLRLHYELTLAEWLRRFEQYAHQVEDMMDEHFVRSWRLYLAGSRAAFSAGRLQLFQVLFTREENNNVPWSRAHHFAESVSKHTTESGMTDA